MTQTQLDVQALMDDDNWKEEIAKLIVRKKTHMLLDPSVAFWSTLSMRLESVMSFDVPTFGTDGKKMFYNPLFVQMLIDQHGKNKAEKMIVFVIAHEVMHCAFAHMVRRGDREHQLWNFAADYSINWILKDAGFTLAPGVLIDDKYKNMSAEEIYPYLKQDKQQNPQNYPGDGSGGIGEVYDHPGNGSGDQDEDEDGKGSGSGDDDQDSGQQQSSDQSGQQSGSGKSDKQGKSDGKQGQMSEAEKKQIASEWQVAAATAAKAHAAKAGSLPGGLKRAVDDLLDPKIPWVDVVREWADVVARGDYTWSRPNSRYMPQGCYLPSLYSVEVGDIVLIMDVSGSVSDPQFTQFASEISSILEELDCHVYALYVDTSVRHVDEFDQDDLPLKIETHGGGGTDFKPGFDWLKKKGIEPEGVIYFTDMQCNSFPDYIPDYPVIWVKYGPDSSWCTKPEEVPFGDYIEM